METTVGFIKEASTLGVSGFNVYHKNRLIRVFNYISLGHDCHTFNFLLLIVYRFPSVDVSAN